MEIIAVYHEPKIKNYGFQVRTDLCLASAPLAADHLAEWGGHIEKMEGKSSFVMALVQMVDPENLRIHLLFDKEWETRTPPGAADHAVVMAGTDFRLESPVELVYFQGPHFGDRYGIADAAFGPLAGCGIRVLAAGCTGASIYIVVAAKQARAVIDCLSENFKVPETTA